MFKKSSAPGILALAPFLSLPLLCFAPAHASIPRPKALDCGVSEGKAPVSRITLTALDTDAPTTNLNAAPEARPEQDSFSLRFCASNPKDNRYCFVFRSDELAGMADGKVQSTLGLMSYRRPSTSSAETETVAIQCKKPIDAKNEAGNHP